jgi:clan AA aspartic protease (TIGR02281 family)
MRRLAPLFVLAAAFGLASAAALAASSCKLVKIAEWQVKPQTGRLIVDGAINDQKIGILFDTGASRTFLLRAAADRLGLVRQEALGYRTYGIGGETHAEYAVIDEFKLGTAARRNWRLMVVGEREQGRQYDVLLGYDFFEQVDIEFDLPNNAVRLFQPQDCSDLPLAYWARGGAGVVKLEVDNSNRAILVEVKLNGKPLVAELDTGAPTSVLSRLVAAQLGVTPESRGSVAAGKSAGLGAQVSEQWMGSFESFAIGDELIRNPDIRFANLELITAGETGTRLAARRELRDMLLGLDFLRAHRVYVAHSQGKLYFTYAGGPVFRNPKPQASPPPSKPGA